MILFLNLVFITFSPKNEKQTYRCSYKIYAFYLR